jgi:hypothetical protein
MTLTEIVRDSNLLALERFCRDKTYNEIRLQAIAEDIDLDKLEELLAAI